MWYDLPGMNAHRRFALLLGWIACLSLAHAQVMPRQVRLSFGDSPTNSIRIMWQTDQATDTLVEYGETPALGSIAYGQQVTYSLQTGILHEATLTNLQPDTLYYYRVGDPQNGFSPIYTFRTAPVYPRPFLFTAFGDHGTRSVSRQNTQNVINLNPDFHLHLGDLSYANGVQTVWDTYLDQVEPLTRQIPMMITLGNHEWEDEVGIGYEAAIARFAMPGENTYNVNYMFDYGNVRFIAFNSDWYQRANSVVRNEMQQWLQNRLAEARANPCVRWLIVFQHHPLFGSVARRGYNQFLIDRLQPLFDQYKVDLVLQGHDHIYERTYPLRNSTPVSTATGEYLQGEGTIYITCGGGGVGLYTFGTMPPTTAYRESTYCYLVISLQPGGSLTVEARRVDNSLIEHFSILPTFNADLNRDGCVDDNDLLAVLFDFGATGNCMATDINGDGFVSDDDLLLVLFSFGGGC
ncbi:Alkaline phosphatase [bacterium HR15]|nr:Alkaline phosphatase [bacterium HR15]